MRCFPGRGFLTPTFDASGSILGHGMPNLLPMCAFEIVTQGVNCLDDRFQPTRFCAALVRRASALSSHDPGVVTAQGNCFAFTSRRFKQSIPIRAPGRSVQESTKRQGSLPALGSHGLKCKPQTRARAMGCFPHMGPVSKHVGRRTGMWPVYKPRQILVAL